MGQTRPGQGTPISMSGVIRIWRQAWEEFTPFLRFPPELRRIVYTMRVYMGGCCFDAWMRFAEPSAAPEKAPFDDWRNQMFVIGIDSHKDTLAGCLVDHLGTPLEYRNIANTPAGHRQLVDWVKNSNTARVAVEGSGTYGRPAAVAALSAGLDVREVPPQLTAQVRRRGRTQTKTDQVDALVIARVALRDHTLSAPAFWEDTEDLRVLVSYRRELVEDRTAGANRLHADLGKLRPGYQHLISRLTTRKSLDQAMRLLWRDTTPHARVAKQRIRGLRQLDTGIKQLTAEIKTMVDQSGTRLLDIRGVWCAGGCHDPLGGGRPPPVCDQGQVRHGQRHRTYRGQQRTDSTTSPQPRWEPPTQPGNPHCRTNPNRPQRHRRTLLLPKTHQQGENPQRSPPRPQTTNLRPRLDPPPTTKTSPDYDIGAHTLTQTI